MHDVRGWNAARTYLQELRRQGMQAIHEEDRSRRERGAAAKSRMSLTQRFNGGCEKLADINVDDLASWIAEIDFADWPQQARLADGGIRPSMVTDHDNWHDFVPRTNDIVANLMDHFPGCSSYQRMLSVVMPDHSIPLHADEQRTSWLCRVHVPLISNPDALFVIDAYGHTMKVGEAYRVNTTAEHAVINTGRTPRIHLMFDVGIPS